MWISFAEPSSQPSAAEMVEWILVNNYKIPDLLHYLDDFITPGPLLSSICTHLEHCT